MKSSLLPPKEIGKVSRPLGGTAVPCERAGNKESGVGRFGRRSFEDPREAPAQKCLPLRIYRDAMGHPLFRERRVCSRMRDVCSPTSRTSRGEGFVMYNNKAKFKTLYVKQIFGEETNAEHGLSMRQIVERLEQFGIKAERKSVYRDIEVLREFGCDVRSCQRNPVDHALIRRRFWLPEFMLMVDAVQSSKALTVRQCNALVTNIKLLASDHERVLLDRRIHVQGRIKTKVDSVFGNVDAIHEAMRLKRKVEF